MIAFPHCKINLGLHIIRKRSDGYHDLETIFYPLNIKDILEINQRDNDAPPVDFILTGLELDGAAGDNLCVKAYHLLKKDFPRIGAVRIHLHKIIPAGAGLGGGSSDATTTLRMLDNLFQLHLSTERLHHYALELGSDCPFFLLNKPCFAQGRGELLEEMALDLSNYSFVLVNPRIHINTGWAFSTTTPRDKRADLPKYSLKDAIQLPLSDWKYQLVNDFEQPVFDLYPEIKAIRDDLYTNGALYSAMTGSGSTVFGIFERPYIPSFGKNYQVIHTKT